MSSAREEVVAEIKAIGGDIVLVDGPDLAKRVAAETGNAPITLAVDGVADTSTMNLMGCLTAKVCWCPTVEERQANGRPGATLISGRIDTRILAGQLVQRRHTDKITAMYDRLVPLVVSGAISSPVAATFGFGQIAEAVAVASKNRGKGSFTPG